MRIASYLRRLMTQHWIKIHMKFDSANESVLPLAKQNPGEEPGFSALIPDYSNRFILWVRALLP